MVGESDVLSWRAAVYDDSCSCLTRVEVKIISKGFYKILFFLVVFPSNVIGRINQKENISVKIKRLDGTLGNCKAIIFKSTTFYKKYQGDHSSWGRN